MVLHLHPALLTHRCRRKHQGRQAYQCHVQAAAPSASATANDVRARHTYEACLLPTQGLAQVSAPCSPGNHHHDVLPCSICALHAVCSWALSKAAAFLLHRTQLGIQRRQLWARMILACWSTPTRCLATRLTLTENQRCRPKLAYTLD